MDSTTAPTSPQQLAAELLCFWHFLIKGGAKRLFELLDELDLGFSHVKTLHTMADVGRELSVKELAEEMGMSLPGASRVADALCRRGLVDRREDPDDRRAKRLCVTRAGLDALQRIDTSRLESLSGYTASLTQEQRDRLHDALASLPYPRQQDDRP
jgi:DNA-binding MarR family transcriptional regulator